MTKESQPAPFPLAALPCPPPNTAPQDDPWHFFAEGLSVRMTFSPEGPPPEALLKQFFLSYREPEAPF